MSDDPPDQPKRWRGARRPPSRLATAATLFLTPLAAGQAALACGGSEAPAPDEPPQSYASPEAVAYPARAPDLRFDRMSPARPWFDTLPQVDLHPEHHARERGGERLVRLPPVRVPAMPPPALPAPATDPSWNPSTGSEGPLPLPIPDDGAAVTASGILERHDTRGPAWPDSVGRLIGRRDDDPDRVTIENYFLYLPPGLGTEEREWPVLLYLHGRSLSGDDIDLVKRYGIPSLIERGRQLPFIVLAPQVPAGQGWFDVERMWELLDDVVLEEYPVDEDRIYVTGFSMGGGGAWRFAVRHADRLAAAVPISAATPPPSEAWTEALEELPMLVYHGDADERVPYQPAVVMVEHLREAGQEIHLITLEGEGHGIVQDVYRDPGLYVWLLAHER